MWFIQLVTDTNEAGHYSLRNPETRTQMDSEDEDGSCVHYDQAFWRWTFIRYKQGYSIFLRPRRQSTSTRHHEAQILWNRHLPVEKDLRRNFNFHHSLRTTPSNDIIIKLVFIGKLCLHEYAVTLNKLTDPTVCWYYPIRLYSCPFSKYTLLTEKRNSRYKLSSSVGHDNSSMM